MKARLHDLAFGTLDSSNKGLWTNLSEAFFNDKIDSLRATLSTTPNPSYNRRVREACKCNSTPDSKLVTPNFSSHGQPH